MAGGNALDLGESRLEKLQPALSRTFQELVRIVSDLIGGRADPKDLRRIRSAINQVKEQEETESEGAESEGTESEGTAADPASAS